MAEDYGRFNSEDAGMRANDARLSDMEERLKDLYTKSADELKAQLDAYLEPFDEMDQDMAMRAATGQITEDEYIRWRENRILRTRQMQAQIESLTESITHVDEIAVQMINGELPEIYVNSYNFAGFRGEMFAQAAGYNYNTFAIYNADALRIIIAENPDLIPWDPPSLNIPRDQRWNRSHIQNAIAQGILQGDGIREISNRLLPVVNMDRVAATRTARTAYTAVENEGRRDGTRRVIESGIPMVEPWLTHLDGRTRDTHILLNGTLPNSDGLYGEGVIASGHLLRFPGDPQGDPEQIYNCRCRAQSYLAGVDHSMDDLLYQQMMESEFYDDWIGDKENNITGVRDYKRDEIQQALERQRQLESGEAVNRENQYRIRRMQREGQPIPEDARRYLRQDQPTVQTPTYRTASNRAEAESVLRDLGFGRISPTAIKRINEESLVANVNRLSQLDSIFGVIPNGCELAYGKMNSCAYVNTVYSQGVKTLKLSSNYYDSWQDSNFWNALVPRTIANNRWWMPCASDYYNVSVITHEYGHILQNTLIYRGISSSNVTVPFSTWYKTEQNRIRQEIIAIATEANPEFDVMANISRYGKKNSAEFFAECFMNSQCGSPNELGNATNEWLRRQGFNV